MIKYELPPLYILKNLRDDFKGFFKLEETYYGVKNTVLDKLKISLSPIVKRLCLNRNQTIKLRLAGDGTQVGNKLLNFLIQLYCCQKELIFLRKYKKAFEFHFYLFK